MIPPLPQLPLPRTSLISDIVGTPVNVSEKITMDGNTKCCAYLSGPVPWIQNIYALVWTTLDNMKSVLLDGLVPTQHWGDPVACWFRDRFIFASSRTGATTIGEYREDGSQILRFTLPNNQSHAPQTIVLESGAVLVVNSRHVGPLNLEFNYRSPSGAWSNHYQEFTPPSNLVPSSRITLHQLSDGTIYLFIIRDGSSAINLFRIKENDSKTQVQVLDWIGGFLRNAQGSSDGQMSPHGEFPWLVSAYDRWKNRILLSYQNNTSGFFCGVGVSKPVITAVTPGTVPGKQLIYASPTYVDQQFSVNPVFPGPDGVDLLLYQVDPSACGGRFWRMTRVLYDSQPPVIVDTETIPGDRGQMSWSPDGYSIYQEPDQKWVFGQLTLTQIRPSLKIERAGANVVVSSVWIKPATDYELQSSTDSGASWTNEARQNGDVWTFPYLGPSKIFRLKKNS